MNNSFSKYIVDEQMLFKHAKGTGALKGREFHEYYEIILFLDGELEFFSDEMRVRLKKDQLIMIPKQMYHQFVIKGREDDYHRCVFNFYDSAELCALIEKSMGRLRVVDASDYVKLLFGKAIEIAESELDEKEKKTLLRSLLFLIINELSGDMPSAEKSHEKGESSLSLRALEYINAHLCEHLTISVIAKELNISPSLLSHSFKKEMGISPYRYMLKKRLISAQNRIASGESATSVAIECGFSDYSGFYKQYKKTFGVPPSKSGTCFEA